MSETRAPMAVRTADRSEIDRLTEIWFDAWHDAHAQIVPRELVEFRTRQGFRDRLRAALPRVRVSGPLGAPLGFCIVKGDEIYQLFVAAEARGTGVAAALIADAERRLEAAGIGMAWLSCAIGNERAARFYEKSGWRRAGTMIENLELEGDVLPLKVWRYEKILTRPA